MNYDKHQIFLYKTLLFFAHLRYNMLCKTESLFIGRRGFILSPRNYAPVSRAYFIIYHILTW